MMVAGTILCILEGTGTIHIGWFWATFPFWIVPAIGVAVFVLYLIISFIYIYFTTRTDNSIDIRDLNIYLAGNGINLSIKDTKKLYKQFCKTIYNSKWKNINSITRAEFHYYLENNNAN